MRLGGEESIEEAIDIFQRDTGAGIFNRDNYALAAIKLRFDAQKSGSIDHRIHRIDGIRDEVEHYVLQLHPIGHHRWKIFIQFGLNLDWPTPMLALGEHENLVHKRVQIH